MALLTTNRPIGGLLVVEQGWGHTPAQVRAHPTNLSRQGDTPPPPQPPVQLILSTTARVGPTRSLGRSAALSSRDSTAARRGRFAAVSYSGAVAVAAVLAAATDACACLPTA